MTPNMVNEWLRPLKIQSADLCTFILNNDHTLKNTLSSNRKQYILLGHCINR